MMTIVLVLAILTFPCTEGRSPKWYIGVMLQRNTSDEKKNLLHDTMMIVVVVVVATEKGWNSSG